MFYVKKSKISHLKNKINSLIEKGISLTDEKIMVLSRELDLYILDSLKGSKKKGFFRTDR